MWRWCICLLFIFPCFLLPFLWCTFPTHCSEGHIHYANNQHEDAAVVEPWHCHIPRRTGWACTPDFDCLTGGTYGPTSNGVIIIVFIFALGLGLFFYCSHARHDVEYEPPAARSTAVRYVKKNKKRGLESYPLR